jgi:hypothetical protein
VKDIEHVRLSEKRHSLSLGFPSSTLENTEQQRAAIIARCQRKRLQTSQNAFYIYPKNEAYGRLEQEEKMQHFYKLLHFFLIFQSGYV